MRWENLLFAHWPVHPEALRRLLRGARDLELDVFEGRAWLGVVPFTMADVALRGLPAVPSMRSFPELNIRTYVRHNDHGGVLFLSLDATSRIMVGVGRSLFHVPYHLARMSAVASADGIAFSSRRRSSPSATFTAHYRPIGPPSIAPAGSFEAWATDRMRVYAVDRSHELRYAEIEHARWSLQPAEAIIHAGGVANELGLTLPAAPPRLAFSAHLDVLGGFPRHAEH